MNTHTDTNKVIGDGSITDLNSEWEILKTHCDATRTKVIPSQIVPILEGIKIGINSNIIGESINVVTLHRVVQQRLDKIRQLNLLKEGEVMLVENELSVIFKMLNLHL